MDIRLAQFEDIAQIAKIHQQTIEFLAGHVPPGYGASLAEAPSMEEIQGELTEAFADPAYSFFVATESGRIVGYIRGYRDERGDDLLATPFMTLEYVCVTSEYKQLGIARKLLEQLLAHAKAQGIAQLDLLVWANNRPALELFKSMGFAMLEHRMAVQLS
jgi:ribosomal protein S18 acetylase RimI-like enzyme